MKNKKIGIILLLVLVLSLVFTITACDGKGDIAVTSITVPSEMELLVGETEKISYNINPFKATDKTVTFKTNAPAVATVDEEGNVTAVDIGIATIKVTASNGVNADIIVTVVKNAESISIDITENKHIFKKSDKEYDVIIASEKQDIEVPFNANVLPIGASKDIIITSNSDMVQGVSGENKLIVKSPNASAKKISVAVTFTIKKRKTQNGAIQEVTDTITINVLPYHAKSHLEVDLTKAYQRREVSNDFEEATNIYSYDKGEAHFITKNLYLKTMVIKNTIQPKFKPEIEVSVKVDGVAVNEVKKYEYNNAVYIYFDVFEKGKTKNIEVTLTENVTGQEYTQNFNIKCG